MKKCVNTNADINLALLQIPSTQLGPGLSSPTMLLFKGIMRGTMPRMS